MPSEEIMLEILRDWMRYESSDYYRISIVKDEKTVAAIVYEASAKKGQYMSIVEGKTKISEFSDISPSNFPWHSVIEDLAASYCKVKGDNSN